MIVPNVDMTAQEFTHPEDAAALSALESIPLLPALTKKFMDIGAEQMIFIKEIMEREDMKGLIKEGAKQFKEAQRSGGITAVKSMNRCPNCGTPFEKGARSCSECGCDLTKQNK